MFSSVRAVVFDAVGTLIYADPPVAAAYCRAGQRHGSSLSANEIADRFGAAMEQHFGDEHSNERMERQRWSRVVADVFVDLEDATPVFEELWHHFANHRHWAIYDDVFDVWNELESRGLVVAIASNFDQRLLDIASHLTPLDRARSIYVSSQLGYAKPHRKFFSAIEQSLQFAPPELLLVGDDRDKDYEGARRAGWNSLLLDREQTDGSEFVIAALRDVLDYLG
jgi:putative hydrolase of the HAD superfamily